MLTINIWSALRSHRDQADGSLLSGPQELSGVGARAPHLTAISSTCLAFDRKEGRPRQ